MFDSHHHVTQRIQESVTVHQHRAPTDESVRLLREMEQAAREKVTQSIRLENSPIDAVVHAQCDPMTGDREFVVFIKINGKRLEVRKTFRDFDLTTQAIANGLLESVSTLIAIELDRKSVV